MTLDRSVESMDRCSSSGADDAIPPPCVATPLNAGVEGNPRDAIKRACDAVGGQTEMATALKITRQTVHMWCKGTRAVPVAHCRSIRRLTLGAVQIEELQPDVFWCTLPGQGVA